MWFQEKRKTELLSSPHLLFGISESRPSASIVMDGCVETFQQRLIVSNNIYDIMVTFMT